MGTAGAPENHRPSQAYCIPKKPGTSISLRLPPGLFHQSLSSRRRIRRRTEPQLFQYAVGTSFA